LPKGGGKNDKHANSKKKDIAEQKWLAAKDKLKKLKSQYRSDVVKEEIGKTQKEIDHWKQKMDFAGENHSQKAKGN